MELTVVKNYDHVYESDDSPSEDIAKMRAKLTNVFSRPPYKKILLAQCPAISEESFLWENAKAKRYPNFMPYGAAVLVRILEDNGYIADIIDLDHDVISNAYHAASYAKFKYRVWEETLDKKIEEFKPDIIGLSCMFNMGHEPLKNVANYVKKKHNLPVIAGGVHISLTTEQLLRDIEAIDFALLYEADQSIITFIGIVNGNTPIDELCQIATLHNNQVIKLSKRSTPVELLYSPDYKNLPIREYSKTGKIGAYTFLRSDDIVAATVLSARGCRAKCGFCSVRSVNGAGVRTRTAKDVVDEIEFLTINYGVSHIMWLDDDLFYNGERAIELFETLAERKLGITWDASNGIIAAALNPRLVKACVDSGCIGFNIGIESGNPEMLLMMKKPGTVQSFRRAAKFLEDAPKIFVKGFLVIGFPNETLAMLMDSVNLALELRFDWYPIQILTPMPGTPIFQMMQDQNLLGDIPTTVLGKARNFSVGVTSGMGKRERLEKKEAKDFRNLFAGDLSRVPNREEMEDIWFTIDYHINYGIILVTTDRKKLEKKRAMLIEICNRMTNENALGTLFLSITEFKLGNLAEARRLFELACTYIDSSVFWQKRFSALGIQNLLSDTKKNMKMP